MKRLPFSVARLPLMGLFAAVLLASCARPLPPLEWESVGGSRSDGTVKLSYKKGWKDTRLPDNDAALEMAKKRCKAWGYSYAEAFDGETESCLMQAHGKRRTVCTLWRHTREYQCMTESHSLRGSKTGGENTQNIVIQLQPQ
ncbi:YecR family lipoprotein [Kingella sp. SNUBH-2017]|uniref:YecR family lipoprotein n=1 Tax=Kingella sp. SNUBH-2017 TaxID=2994077 RepID=UPI002363B94F|nr:YecR family lipoprotein [Kingella sp. SNUBH-2017]MDD2182025.1 YecR family lipoprotein [Kingella sp. SNUBH-2017]